MSTDKYSQMNFAALSTECSKRNIIVPSTVVDDEKGRRELRVTLRQNDAQFRRATSSHRPTSQRRSRIQPQQPQQDRTKIWQWIAIIAIVLALIGMGFLYIRSVKTAPQYEAELESRIGELELALSTTPIVTLPTMQEQCNPVEGMTVETVWSNGVRSCIYRTNPPTQISAQPTVTPSPTHSATSTAVPPVAPTLDEVLTKAKNPPFETLVQTDDKGNKITTLKGFDLQEFGGNDSKCTRSETETIHIGEVVSSQAENCLIVIEWSLKFSDTTIIAGVYAVEPGEWFYIPLAVAGLNDSPRIVGTIWYLPKGWNAHMFSANLASARDARDGTISYVGLSPTDNFVVQLANMLK